MVNVYELPDRKIVEQEALDWLIRLDGDEELNPEEREALREWLARSPVHREELIGLNEFWSNNVLTELVVPLGKTEVRADGGPFGGITRWGWHGAGWAASVALVVLGLLFAVGPRSDGAVNMSSNGLYVTALGQRKTVALADGSVVQLNTNSQIKVDYNRDFRNIWLLQGEVHFEVAEHPDRQFRVYAGGGRVEAVGTAFTVYLKERNISVLVTEGRVALASLGRQGGSGGRPDSPVDPGPPGADMNEMIDPTVNSLITPLGYLDAGQHVIVSRAGELTENKKTLDDAIESVTGDELVKRQAWREGFLIFTGEPLRHVVEEISRFTNISIEIADPAVGEIQIGGRFKVGKTEEMFQALEVNFDLKVIKLGYNRVKLTAVSPKCKKDASQPGCY